MNLDLTDDERDYLLAVYQANGCSTKGHSPKRHIEKFLSADLKKPNNKTKKRRDKAHNNLKKSGMIIEAPTGRNVTYKLSKDGWHEAKFILDNL